MTDQPPNYVFNDGNNKKETKKYGSGLFNRLRSRFTFSYILKRIISMIIVFIVVLVLIFILPHLMPGNFVTIYVERLAAEHPGVNIPLIEARLDKLYGVNKPLYVQFLIYIKQLFSLHPNFGPSFEYYPESAWAIVGYAIKWTLLLLGTSQAVSWVTGIFLGTWLSTKKDKIIDRIAQPTGYFFSSMPAFWVAMISILVFAVYLHVVPASGAYNLTPTAYSIFRHMILPMSVIVLVTLPSHTLVIRSAAVEAMGSDFVRVLKAQGFSSATILKRVMKNAFLPSITNLMLNIGYLIGGIFTVEITFSYPGMGYIIAQGVLNEDYPVIEAALYLTTLVVLLANLVADLLYPLIDPRVSYLEGDE